MPQGLISLVSLITYQPFLRSTTASTQVLNLTIICAYSSNFFLASGFLCMFSGFYPRKNSVAGSSFCASWKFEQTRNL